MPNIFNFSEDSLPRHFPKSKLQLEQLVVPKPLLPAVSLISTENRNVPKPVIKKSFQKWKAQHEAIFNDNSTEQEIKSEKKQVRFDTNDLYHSNRQSLPNQRTHHRVSPCLELSYYESPNCLQNNDCYSKQQQTHQHFNECNSRNIFKGNYSSQFINGHHGHQSTMNVRSHDRVQRSESMKENSNFCRRINECYQTSNHQSTDAQAYCQGEKWKESAKELQKLALRSDGIFVKIMEEQQQHILFQQNQILMHEKNNLEQQKQICMLQLRIQQLLLRNDIKSPTKEHETICDKMSPVDMFNALNTKNCATKQIDFGSQVAPSNDLMLSFSNDLKDIHELNETNLANLGKEKLRNIEALDDSGDNFFLSGRNGSMENSSAINNRRINGHASPNHSGISITSQTLIYEALSTNESRINSQKATDRSFALHMLGMKYKCEEDNGSANTDQRGLYNYQSNDQFYENNPSETYEYLIRHGLMKR